jgi:hypothetical protein
VPDVEVGGLSVGPVWFSVRPDDTFKNFMTQMMDKQIVGAVGGSLLKSLCMIIDYPGARAYFRVGSDPDRDQERSVPASHQGSRQWNTPDRSLPDQQAPTQPSEVLP